MNPFAPLRPSLLSLFRLCLAVAALCVGVHVHAQPLERPASAAAAQAEAGNGVRPDRGTGKGLKPPGSRGDDVSRGPARPRHYPSTALPPVPAPPVKR